MTRKRCEEGEGKEWEGERQWAGEGEGKVIERRVSVE